MVWWDDRPEDYNRIEWVNDMETNVDTQTLLGAAARHALTTAAGMLAANGFIKGSDTEQFVGAGMVVAALIWSWWQKKGQAQVAEALARLRTHVRAIPTPESAPDASVSVAVNRAKEVANDTPAAVP